jgi:FtsP/CotA-like multicopper oxidase with cupredoxin domain
MFRYPTVDLGATAASPVFAGGWVVAPIRVEIPFAEIGDFVYHCHILEHEDGSTMAHIRVVAHH